VALGRRWGSVVSLRAVTGLAFTVLALVAITVSLADAGITWDEPLYMKASRGYMTWLGILRRDPGEAFSDAAIVRWWVQDPTLELHPPLGKFLSGITWAAFRGFLGDVSALRVSNAVLYSVLVGLVFAMVSTEYGTLSGVFAAMSLLCMPRMFFHAHLANIDTTVATTWFLAMWVFWRLESRSDPGAILASGLFFGLALATKMNAIVIPLVWGTHVLLAKRVWRGLVRVGLICVVGAGVFVGTWPWLYHDLPNRLLYYVSMASRFAERPQYYLGQTLPHVTWHYPFVLTAVVIPLAVVAMSLIGTAHVLRRRDDSGVGRLFVLNALAPLVFAATGLQAAYSGERHFIPAYPYLACLAGVGFGATWKMLRSRAHTLYQLADSRRLQMASALGLGLLLLPAAISIWQMHPYQLSYYSELIGGLPGATRLGLETTFWCETYQAALPYLNGHAATSATVWAENPFVMRAYQDQGRLREDLQIIGGDTVPVDRADYAVVQMRQTGLGYYTPDLTGALAGETPVYSLERQGVPLMHVYRLAGHGVGS